MRAQSAGFTLIEMGVVVAIMGILLAVGMPSMSNFILGRKAAGAAVFYQDGLALARNQAIARNANTRLVMTENAANGQMDWRVDICKPDTGEPCDAASSGWSTLTPAANDKTLASVQRSAGAMPGPADLAQNFAPAGATDVYFTPLGWVNGAIAPHLSRMTIAPGLNRRGAFKPLTVAITLGGIATVCDADAAAHSPRGCPP